MRARLALEAEGSSIATGIPFFDHMLSQIARHGKMLLEIEARGDLEVDAHHTVEDVGIALGEAALQALSDRLGIARFAHAYAPLDEVLARVVLDLSGRGGLFWRAGFSRPWVGGFDTDLVREFFCAFARNARFTLHVDLLAPGNAHHEIEAVFKAFALAFGEACRIKGSGIPSTKGMLV